MAEWLAFLLSLSAAGSCVAAVTAAVLRLCRGRVPRRWLYPLWIPALLSFFLPIGVVRAEESVPQQVELVIAAAERGDAPVARQEGVTPVPKRQVRWQEFPLMQAAFAVWAAGAASVLAWRWAGCGRFRRRVLAGAAAPEAWEQERMNRLLKGGRGPKLLRCRDDVGPLLMGMGRSGVLLLPRRRFSPEELEDVLEHELCHWRRRDLAVKRLVMLCTCVHWFNPVSWKLAEWMDRDCELACDEQVSSGRSRELRLRYGRTLVLAAAGGERPEEQLTARMCGQKQRLKERLETIMEEKRYGRRAAAILGIAVLAVAMSTAVFGVQLEPKDRTPQAAPGETWQEPRAEVESGLPQGTAPEENQPLRDGPRDVDSQPGEAFLLLPVNQETLRVSTLYGQRRHPITGEITSHAGIDIKADRGSDVLASGGGTAAESGFEPAYGNYVLIDHGAGVSTLYAHLESRAVEQGDTVVQGQVIGQVGSTGMATGPHLHFEVRRDGNRIDPLTALGIEEDWIAAER